jgi:outer membrane protein W
LIRRFVLVLLFAPSLFAQVRVSAFASDVFETDANGFGAAIEYRLHPRWAVELAAASETRTVSLGLLSGRTKDVRTHPIDLTLHYYFVNQTRWQPFLGAGVRHLTSDDSELAGGTSAEIDGGFHFMITPSFSIRADGRVLFDNGDTISFGPAVKLSGGVGWKF